MFWIFDYIPTDPMSVVGSIAFIYIYCKQVYMEECIAKNKEEITRIRLEAWLKPVPECVTCEKTIAKDTVISFYDKWQHGRFMCSKECADNYIIAAIKESEPKKI